MARYVVLVRSVALPLGLALLLVLASLNVIQAEEHEAEQFQIVADGLDNPRGLGFSPRGELYIAEAGRGAEVPEEAICAAGPEGEVCFGLTGAISVVWRGEQRRVVTGLPSLGLRGGEGEGGPPPGSFASGPHDVALMGAGNVYVIMGLGADPAVREQFGPRGGNFGELLRLTRQGGWRTIIDVAGYESRENPDGGHIDSNPYSVLALPSEVIVVDAGGNSLLRVHASGRISTLAVFPEREVPAPSSLELPPGTNIPMQSVPTTVAQGPDGAYYVGELTGFPFPEGEARVYRVEPGQEPEVFADGFTNIIGIAFDEDGELYVLEIATNGLLSGDMTGALKRADGTIVASEGLIAPAGLAVGPDGALYVSNCGICPGEGTVVRIEP